MTSHELTLFLNDVSDLLSDSIEHPGVIPGYGIREYTAVHYSQSFNRLDCQVRVNYLRVGIMVLITCKRGIES